MTTVDHWLFLPPEVEALAPRLLALLTGRDEAAEAERIEDLVLQGDSLAWRHFLRTVAPEVVAYAGPHLAEQRLLAAILEDQFILAQAVLDPEPEDVAARERLRSIARS
jgi:hypothetical protein